MVVEKLGQVIYPATNMEASLSFYRDVVGLKLKFSDGARWASFDCGSVTFALTAEDSAASEAAIGSQRGGVAAFRVSDIHEFGKSFAARDQEARIVEGAHELLLEVRDPAGNKLVFYQPKPA